MTHTLMFSQTQLSSNCWAGVRWRSADASFADTCIRSTIVSSAITSETCSEDFSTAEAMATPISPKEGAKSKQTKMRRIRRNECMERQQMKKKHSQIRRLM